MMQKNIKIGTLCICFYFLLAGYCEAPIVGAKLEVKILLKNLDNLDCPEHVYDFFPNDKLDGREVKGKIKRIRESVNKDLTEHEFMKMENSLGHIVYVCSQFNAYHFSLNSKIPSVKYEEMEKHRYKYIRNQFQGLMDKSRAGQYDSFLSVVCYDDEAPRYAELVKKVEVDPFLRFVSLSCNEDSLKKISDKAIIKRIKMFLNLSSDDKKKCIYFYPGTTTSMIKNRLSSYLYKLDKLRSDKKDFKNTEEYKFIKNRSVNKFISEYTKARPDFIKRLYKKYGVFFK